MVQVGHLPLGEGSEWEVCDEVIVVAGTGRGWAVDGVRG